MPHPGHRGAILAVVGDQYHGQAATTRTARVVSAAVRINRSPSTAVSVPRTTNAAAQATASAVAD
jgi:hypothetical protein